MSSLKNYFDGKKSKMKKRSHRKKFPRVGRDWEKEKQDKGYTTIKDTEDETKQ